MPEIKEIRDVKSVREMRDENPWLASEDFMGCGDVDVTLARVTLVNWMGATKTAYHFAGYRKPLLGNAGHRKALTIAHGHGDVSRWKGCRITLFVTRLDRTFAGRDHGIRMKNIRKANGGDRAEG